MGYERVKTTGISDGNEPKICVNHVKCKEQKVNVYYKSLSVFHDTTRCFGGILTVLHVYEVWFEKEFGKVLLLWQVVEGEIDQISIS